MEEATGVLVRRAIALEIVGKVDEALAVIDAALGVDPMDYELHARRAQLLRLADRHDEALQASNLLIQIDPSRAEGHTGVAHALATLRKPRQAPWDRSSPAIRAAQAAVSLDPYDSFAWLQLVRAQIVRRNQRGSRKALDRMAAHHPDHPMTAIAAAVDGLAWRTRFRPWCVLLALVPGGLMYVLVFAVAAVRSGRRLRRADALLATAIARDPDDPQLLGLRGQVQHQLGRSRDGLRSTAASARIRPDVDLVRTMVRRSRAALASCAFLGCVTWLVVMILIDNLVAARMPTPAGIALGLVVSTGIVAAVTWWGRRLAEALPANVRPRLAWTVALCLLGSALVAALIGAGSSTQDPWREPQLLESHLDVLGWTTAVLLTAGAATAALRAVRRERGMWWVRTRRARGDA